MISDCRGLQSGEDMHISGQEKKQCKENVLFFQPVFIFVELLT